ncbi:hypothetical protein BCV69DRAFT_280939 [Microstroma glucosiphilum]|uniref:Uncharacterized protein n=1 Tax=Pseudomicrostroma glucosiphilum TaxID=1684307 RepID=A0A316UG33_9BASI|nr:hypothetical protein BCV69DRAFT_280939 [Pseudomicrostroma glucosiphilum]PWN23331.1 hypothetical protein BCV69DRAFT_280939 [Pseudomicrostroma glucosiphilum]
MPGIARLGSRLSAQSLLARARPCSIQRPLQRLPTSSGLASSVRLPSSRLTHSKAPTSYASTALPSPFRSASSAMTSTQRNTRSLATAAPGSAQGGQSPLDTLPPGFEIRDHMPSASSSSSSSAPYALFTKDLERPDLDDREYRIIALANGLEALVIRDPTTDKASAAMDVRVGQLSDPEDFQGLAHFCEHLLFMGTEKYPRENEYSEYLSNHSGASNAYTGMENTNYFFDVGHQHLEGALDRFSQFFLTPLFDASCTEREIRAVDSEHKKNLQSDTWRAFQLDKSLSDPRHPYSHFGTGSAKTLWDQPRQRGQDVRDELLKFHDRYYSANVMKLVILGRDSLDQLTDWVVDKFSGVRNKGLAAPTFPNSPLGEEQLKTQVFFRSVKDIRLLDITFPIPDQTPQFRAKPGQFVSHFVGHEGQGSILSHLKKRGWANHLSAGATNGADGFEFFKISVDLTKEGLKNYENVVLAVFRYLDLLKQSSIPQWTYNEVSSLCDLAFRFSEKIPPSSYASGLSTQMQNPYPREWVLSGPYLTRNFDVDLIKKTLSYLSPERCRVTVAAQECPDGTQAWDRKEKWYGTEYKLSPLPSKLLEQPSGAEFEDLALPGPNNFIPQTFDLAGGSKQEHESKRLGVTKRPQLIKQTPLGRLWHKKDDQFFLPKANVFMLLRSPLIDATPANAVKSRMFVELLKDAMTEYAYDAELAGLGYNVEAQADGFGISVDGYNDKLPVLLSYVLKAVKNFEVDPVRFEMIKDSVSRQYENFRQEAPYQHANYYTSYLTVERMWTPTEKLVELKEMTSADVQRFIPDLLARLHVEMLAHGNLTESQAGSLMDLAESTLAAKPLSPTELISPRSLILPTPSDSRWRRQVSNKDNVNSSIELYCQVGDPLDVEKRATLGLMSQIASEPVFDQLRTKEQLGYLVFSSVRRTIGSMGYRIIIQSERDADFLESRIEAFFEQFKKLLEEMSPAEFEKQKASLIAKKLEVVKNLGEESTRFWFHIHSGYYDFLARERDVEALKKVSKSDVLELFMQYIHPSSPTRAKLSVHVQSQVKAKMFSTQAAEALKAQLSAGGEGTPQPPAEAWEMLLKGETSVDSVKEFVKSTLATAGAPEPMVAQVLGAVEALAEQFPAPVVEGSEVEKSATSSTSADVSKTVEVHDPAVFKAGLVPSKASQPIRSWEEYMAEPERKDLEAEAAEIKAQTSHL